MVNFDGKGFAKSVGLLIVMLLITYGIPLLLGNSSGEFTVGSQTYNIQSYYNWYVAIFLVIFASIFYVYFTKKGDETYGNSIFFANNGDFPSIPFFKRFSMIQLSFLFFILLTALFTFIAFAKPETSLTGGLGQQFTTVTYTGWDISLIPGAENIGLAGIVIVPLSLFFGIMARKKNWSTGTFVTILFTSIVILSGVYGVLNHLLNPVYASSQQDLTEIGFIWGLMGLLVCVTGLFLIGWEFHFINNLVYDLQHVVLGVSGTQTVLLIALVGMIVIYSFMYNGRWFGTKNKAILKKEVEIYT